MGTLVLFLTLGEIFSIFTIEDHVCYGFIIYGFYYVEVCSFSSTLAWKIPWMEEPGGLQSMGLLRVGHD